MDFRHVNAFIAVAEELSLRRAGRRLGVSQPALSRQVQQLEQELGLTLFVRHPDGIELTHHGTLMLDQARRLASAATRLADNVRAAESHRRGAVRLGIPWGLWPAVNRIRRHHASRMPGVAVLGEDMVSWVQADALRQRRIDAGLVRPPVDTRDLRCEPVFNECVVVVLPATHPLAGRGGVRLRELASERLLLHERDLAPGIYDKIFELYASAGITPRVVPTSASPATPAGMIQVASGKGIYLGLGSLAAGETAGIAMVRLDEPRASLPVCVAWRAAESSPVVLQFIESVREALSGQPSSRARRMVAADRPAKPHTRRAARRIHA
jgi:DNA-binding transcriptional LysR family regulator